MAGVAQGKLNRRLRKRIRQMKQAEQGTAVWRTGHAADRANIHDLGVCLLLPMEAIAGRNLKLPKIS